MKRTLCVIMAAVLFFSVALTGCGSAPKQPANQAQSSNSAQQETQQKKEEPKKTTQFSFWTFQALHQQFIDDAVASWNKANANKPIAIKTDVYPYDEMHNKLLIALQSGTGAPDIVDIEISKYSNYLKGKNPALVPLNKIVEPELDKMIKARFDNYAKDGKYYGIDYHVGAAVMYYNKEILDKADVNADDIKTWSDYVAAGKKVVAATGVPMTTIEVTDQWTFYPMISQQGSDYLDKDGNPILDNETNIKTLQFLKDMIYTDKIAIPTPGGKHHTEEYYAFMNKGGAASVLMPIWYMGRFVQYMPDLKGKIIVRPLPKWKDDGFRSAGMGGTGTSITVQCKNVDLAMEFLSFAKLSKEGAKKTWTVLGFDPIRWDVWEDPEMKADNKYTDYFGKGIFDMLVQIKDEINPINVGEKFPAAAAAVKKDVMFKALKEQSLTPEQSLKATAEELRKK
jgi:arabinosaccharide transport system substrate-binding protein